MPAFRMAEPPGTTVPSPNAHHSTIVSGASHADAVAMTKITRWQLPGAKRSRPGPLPEPPRASRVSKRARFPTDRLGRALEDWLSDLSVSSTADAD